MGQGRESYSRNGLKEDGMNNYERTKQISELVEKAEERARKRRIKRVAILLAVVAVIAVVFIVLWRQGPFEIKGLFKYRYIP